MNSATTKNAGRKQSGLSARDAMDAGILSIAGAGITAMKDINVRMA
jgi:hypothetical protein